MVDVEVLKEQAKAHLETAKAHFEVVKGKAIEHGTCVFNMGKKLYEENPLAFAGVTAGALLVLFVLYYILSSWRASCRAHRKISKGKFFGVDKLNNAQARPFYDVAIVGAGPSGSSAGFYLAKGGAKVLLLEAKKFPRDKHCGDAVCKTAIEILIDMGIFDKLIKENKAHVADSGGLVSPGGISYVGRSHEELGTIPAAVAVKRTDLDEAIAMAAKGQGADLKELSPVETATFDKTRGLWTVTLADGKTSYDARVLVCADGAPSRLAGKLGLVTEAPQGVCSRSFVDGKTHAFDADGVVFYDKDLLPGYAAIFKHPNNELNFCTYIIPGNPLVKNEDLKREHYRLLENDPVITKAMGKNYKIEDMKAGPLRLGGIQKSWDEHLLIIGDAAGLIDPMTGEGIHHAMDSGRIAAGVLKDAISQGNYSASALKVYHDRWMHEFGFDFWWSMFLCQVLYRFPILIDAATAAVKRKGNKFLARWADIMTGRVPKIHLLRPEFVIVITFELWLLILKKIFCCGGKKAKKAE